MHKPKKELGFIIRRGRRPNEDQQERKRYMSQTQFYKKGNSHSSTPRAPGQILHVKLKDEIGFIRSSHSNYFNNEDLESNPESRLRFKFEESKNDFHQKDDNEEEEKDDRFPDLNIEKNIHVFKILEKLHYQIQHRTSSAEVLSAIKEYLNYINENQLASVLNMQIAPLRKKIIKDSLLFERVAVLLVSLVEVLDKYEELKSYLANLVNFGLENLLLRLSLLTEGTDKSVLELLKSKNKEKFLSKGIDVIKGNNQMMNEGISRVSRADNIIYENFKKLMKMNKTMNVKGQFVAIQEYYAFFLCASNHSETVPFLSVAPAPYLPEQPVEKYTLVIDVLECFCSKSKKAAQTFRPFSEYFLDEMSKYFEIVCFSDAMPMEVNRVVSLLDKKKLIKYKLYSYHHDKSKVFNGKDLCRLGRNLNSTILIDTSSQESNNTITISPWKGKKNDAELAELCPILAMISMKKVAPQVAIRKMKEKKEENHRLGLKYLNCGIDFE